MGITGKDFSRLGQSAQRQVLQKLGKQQHDREAKTQPRNKYHANPTDVLMPDGSYHRFPSAKEARRYQELAVLQRAGDISDLRFQVPYELVPRQVRPDGKKEQPVRYIADFVYTGSDGLQVVEDVKGYADTASAAYKLYTVKRKLMLHVHGITIKEV